MGQKLVPVGEYVDHLKSFEKEPITRDRVLEFCLETAVEPGTLDRYVHFRDDTYTRNLIFRDEAIELMAVCWQPGQRPVLHTHNGQLGGRGVHRGPLAVVNYKYPGCNAPDNQNVSGLDPPAGATELDIDRRD